MTARPHNVCTIADCNRQRWHNSRLCVAHQGAVKTNNVFPPIPIRTCDWVAWYNSLGEDGSPYGYGTTEAESIADLITNYPPEDYLS